MRFIAIIEIDTGLFNRPPRPSDTPPVQEGNGFGALFKGVLGPQAHPYLNGIGSKYSVNLIMMGRWWILFAAVKAPDRSHSSAMARSGNADGDKKGRQNPSVWG